MRRLIIWYTDGKYRIIDEKELSVIDVSENDSGNMNSRSVQILLEDSASIFRRSAKIKNIILQDADKQSTFLQNLQMRLHKPHQCTLEIYHENAEIDTGDILSNLDTNFPPTRQGLFLQYADGTEIHIPESDYWHNVACGDDERANQPAIVRLCIEKNVRDYYSPQNKIVGGQLIAEDFMVEFQDPEVLVEQIVDDYEIHITKKNVVRRNFKNRVLSKEIKNDSKFTILVVESLDRDSKNFTVYLVETEFTYFTSADSNNGYQDICILVPENTICEGDLEKIVLTNSYGHKPCIIESHKLYINDNETVIMGKCKIIRKGKK